VVGKFFFNNGVVQASTGISLTNFPNFPESVCVCSPVSSTDEFLIQFTAVFTNVDHLLYTVSGKKEADSTFGINVTNSNI